MKESDDKLRSFERLVSDDTTNLSDSSPRAGGASERTNLEELVGATIDGKYKIVQLIGTGGLSAVYEAFHEEMGRRVAIKVLLPQWSSDAIQVKRFRREAQFLSQLNHGNIASVHSCGLTDKNDLYLTMEFVEGTTLDKFLAKHRLTSMQCTNLFLPLAEAIAFAHGQGIIHRDLKPQNIMITGGSNGFEIQPKVLDFGIAKMFSAHANQKLTATGAVVGSPVYMSPEQFTGRQSGASSDIYSFGCVLYQAIAGRPPFVFDTVFEYMTAHLNQAPPEIPERSKQDSDPERRSLIAIAVRCLAKSPDQRFASMEEVCAALKQAHDSPTVSVNFGVLPQPVSKRNSKFFNRGSGLWAIVAVVSATLAFGVSKSPYIDDLLNGKSKTSESSFSPLGVDPDPGASSASAGELMRQGNVIFDQADHDPVKARRIELRRLASLKYRAALKDPKFKNDRDLRCMLAHCLSEETENPKSLREAEMIFEQLLAEGLARHPRLKDKTSRTNNAEALVNIYQRLGILHLVADKNYVEAEKNFKDALTMHASQGDEDYGPLWGLQLAYRYQKRAKEADAMALRTLDILRLRSLEDWYRGMVLSDVVMDIKEARGWTLKRTKEFVAERFSKDLYRRHTIEHNKFALGAMDQLLPDDSKNARKHSYELPSDGMTVSPKPTYLD